MLDDMIRGFGALRRAIKPNETNYPSYDKMVKELSNVVDDPKRNREDKEKARKLISEFIEKGR